MTQSLLDLLPSLEEQPLTEEEKKVIIEHPFYEDALIAIFGPKPS